MSTDLRDRLDELVDRCDSAHGDWQDVLRRAAVSPAATAAPPTPSSRRHRLALALAVLLALAIGLLATPAFGLREAMLDLIGREDVAFEEGERAPLVVRRQFEDLALGVPPQMDPQAQPDQMRRVGTFRLGGRDRALWVGPTRRGGFCYSLEKGGGGCLADPRDGKPPAIAHSLSGRQRVGESFELQTVTGWLFAPEAERLTLEFEDGPPEDISFVFVSAPIDAGFFAHDLRGDPRRLSAIVLRDAAGGVLARETIDREGFARPLRVPPTGPQKPRPLPAKPPVPPTPPLQRGEHRGVRVTAGANGAVQFDTSGAHREVAELLDGKAASFVCFRMRSGEAQALGHWGASAPTVGARYFGLQTPFDGCEIQGSYGHRWPDRFASHSPVEIAFTERGRRYYEDRAAARDLALLVRSARVQQIRKLEPASAAERLLDEYAIDELDTRTMRPAAGRIGVFAGDGELVLRRVATTGRVFEIEIADGRIARENVSPFTKVF
jgi:hypothetical protein